LIRQSAFYKVRAHATNMFNTLSSFFGQRTPQKGPPVLLEPSSSAPAAVRNPADRRQTFSKVFRWRLPAGQTEDPKSVEVVGSFTHWQKVALVRDGKLDAWHTTIHHIPGNKTHHYMLLVNGEPFYDKQCDGLAVPHGPQEERFQMKTDKGPRVLMLFAQTK
jgi:hypothetical protein